jgi:hypothetical protein
LLATDHDIAYDAGNMGKECYEGIWAHAMIQLYYRHMNPGHQIDTDLSIERIAAITSGQTPARLHARLRPDILDRTLSMIWEIKPLRRQVIGALQLEVYRNVLGPNLHVTAGDPGLGTEGAVFVPGGRVHFGLRIPGIIRYEYIRSPMR